MSTVAHHAPASILAPSGAWVRAGAAPAIDPGRLVVNAVLIAAVLMLNLLGTPGSILFFLILAVMVLYSPRAAFKSLAICYLGLMINQAFVPKSLVWTPGRLILPYLALIRFLSDLSALRYSLLKRPSYIALLVFVATMAVCSIASGWYPRIALLKLQNFLVFVTTVFAGTAVLRLRKADIGEWFMSLILAATLFGVGSVAFGVSRNFRATQTTPGILLPLSGFNGAFLHPNAHAIYASLFVAFLAIIWVLSRYRRPWLAVPIMGCWFVFIAWSASRTSFISSSVAILTLLAYARPFRGRQGWRIRPNLSRGTLAAIAGAAVIGAVVWNTATGGSLGRSLVAFINKGSSETGALDAAVIISSRKGLIDFSWSNFQESPVFGIGFGVAKTELFRSYATIFTAPAEKGFLPTAILEEGGVLGTAAFLIFIGTLLWELRRERNIAGLVAFVTFLCTNFGEVTIFAPGGGGAFGWIAVGAAMVLGDQCWRPAVPERCSRTLMA